MARRRSSYCQGLLFGDRGESDCQQEEQKQKDRLRSWQEIQSDLRKVKKKINPYVGNSGLWNNGDRRDAVEKCRKFMEAKELALLIAQQKLLMAFKVFL